MAELPYHRFTGPLVPLHSQNNAPLECSSTIADVKAYTSIAYDHCGELFEGYALVGGQFGFLNGHPPR